jgi:hypothetical protein
MLKLAFYFPEIRELFEIQTIAKKTIISVSCGFRIARPDWQGTPLLSQLSYFYGQYEISCAPSQIQGRGTADYGRRTRYSELRLAVSKEWGKESVYATKGDNDVTWVGKVK